MKIKLAIVEKDKGYLDRIVSVFGKKYADVFEVYSFTDPQIALQTVQEVKIDVLLADESCDIEFNALPSRCGFAYLVDSKDIEMFNNQRTICKFQKVDLIYKQILSIYSEIAGSTTGVKGEEDNCRIIAFASPSGGAGSSTAAAACALHFAAQGKKILYLNLETFGSSDVFFSAEGLFTMSDVIYALKSKKANLALKLESCVRQDQRGVYFFSQSQMALDMLEMTEEDTRRLISELRLTGSYDMMILDMEFGIEKTKMDIFGQAANIVFVGDGSETSNVKIFRAYQALATLEQGKDISVIGKIAIMYNKFSNKTSSVIENVDLKNVGGAPRYEHVTTAQVLTQLSRLGVFDNIAGL